MSLAVEMCNIHIMIAIAKGCLYHDTIAIYQDICTLPHGMKSLQCKKLNYKIYLL